MNTLRAKMKKLIEAVWQANLKLNKADLTALTWGNASQINRAAGLIAIKPSGVAYEKMRKEDIVLTNTKGKTVASNLRPSSDLPSHLVIYHSFPSIGAVVHTHSTFATAFAQACLPVPCLGTTHADYCLGRIPVTDPLTPSQTRTDYERHTGEMIAKKIYRLKLSPTQCPFILAAHHGPFVWGRDAAEAVENAIVLEYLCKMAFLTRALTGKLNPIPQTLIDKHFFRKHGRQAYYGQEKGKGQSKIR